MSHFIKLLLILVSFICVVLSSPPKIARFDFGSDITAGSRVTTTCSIVSGTPPFDIQWLKDGRPVSSSGNVLFDSGRQTSVVVIKPVAAEDVANYTCLVKNNFGTDSFTARLLVKSPPAWIVKPMDIEASKGMNLTVKCQVSGEPKPRITWKRLRGVSWEHLNSNHDELILQSVKIADKGTYGCEADNGIEKPLLAEFQVNVKVPAKFDDKFSRVTVKKGESVKVDCSAKGDQPMTITWTKESTNLKSKSERYEILETLTNDGIKSELFVRSADREDGGLYLCLATNTYGKDEKSSKLLVIEEPAAPTNLILREVWSRSASISWTSPFAGNSAITGYVVQYWRETENGENKRLKEEPATSSQTSFMLKNLLPGSSYEITVVAMNEVGRGPTSNLVKFKTGDEEPSGSPLDIITEAKGPKTIRVSWKAPHKEKWNGQLTGFYVGYKQTSDFNKPFSLRTIPLGNTNYTYEYLLQGLNKATEYTVIVKAFNAAGSGPDSQEVISKTLSGELPPSPKLFLFTITTDSVSLMWKMTEAAYSSSKISGFSIHYKPEYQSLWKEISIPAGSNREDGEHILKGLEPNSIYYIYVTAINNYGHGDPSSLLTIKTRGFSDDGSSTFTGSIFSSRENIDLMAFQQDMLSFISITIAVVVVIIVIIISFVCIKKAQLEASKPPLNLCAAPRLVEADKSGVYIGTTHRYVDFDQRPLMQGNIAHLVDAQGNVYPAQFATLAAGCSTSLQQQQQLNEEMKSFVSTPKPWQRPLPMPNDGAQNRKSTIQENVYDFPSAQ